MSKVILRVLALACALALASQGILGAQSSEASEEPPRADTLAVPDVLSAVERLKAKVDSLRQALAESPERRRQSVARQASAADSLYLAYDFASAVDILRTALASADSSQAGAVEEALIRSRNALKMTGSVSQVRVKARSRLSREAFFSMYPDADDGADRRFHAISPDGRSLYFSSKDKGGAGGYDLYVSRRDRASGGWSDPINMGYPYSSPFDDILFADSPDGQYSVLVSGRDCAADSLYIYVLAYDPLPPKRAVNDARELRALAGLEPAGRQAAPAPRRRRPGVDMSAYTTRTLAVRALRDSLSASSRELDDLRAGLAGVPEEEQEGYVSAIIIKEQGLDGLRKRLDAATRELQGIELDFLSGGMGQERPGIHEASASDSLALPQLFLISDDGGSFLGVEESGTISPILPTGSFSDYIVFPSAPSYSVRAFIPEGEELPPYALTAMLLYSKNSPEAASGEGGTTYTFGPYNDKLRAGSLRMALLAMGVAEVYVTED